jgi:hypothetical protein
MNTHRDIVHHLPPLTLALSDDAPQKVLVCRILDLEIYIFLIRRHIVRDERERGGNERVHRIDVYLESCILELLKEAERHLGDVSAGGAAGVVESGV